MDPLPSTQRALKVRGPGMLELDEACPLPGFEDDEVLVRVRCVAINPVDAKVIDMAPNIGATAGCEFAGDVVQVGPLVKNKQLKAGVAVFGCVWGNHPNRPDNGAFANFVAVAGDLLYLVPSHLSYPQCASLGVALPTVGMAVYSQWNLRLPYPTHPVSGRTIARRDADAMEKDAARDVGNLTEPLRSALKTPREPESSQYVLVYGGSTACGAIALQMIRKSGLVPVCTCSPHNFAMVKELGAEEAFDYHSPTCGDDIRRYTSDNLAYTFDCITDLGSMRICYTAMGRAGGKYMGLDPVPLRGHTRRDIKPEYVLIYTMFGKEVQSPRPFGRPARPKDRAFAEIWYRSTQVLVDTPGEIRPHPLDQGLDDLDGVIKGLDRMRKGDVSGVKLVYELKR
ncbi:hypothetical protein ABOM_002900 [Aspergillus bombycis]|uniref:Enoyl reductase (ER) domain-containing protein n=1 Tax=Aspergillus bombycis TaxID=109264 RepID=A0A1F8A8E5_9EURO|nr:hypothetical protein ABOM_002900 [Aspergillus bombycis]OGM48040.1 hypothetical protein ABOM_002900 [Aspergillus bombycis]